LACRTLCNNPVKRRQTKATKNTEIRVNMGEERRTVARSPFEFWQGGIAAPPKLPGCAAAQPYQI
jgi:hypothetical protein